MWQTGRATVREHYAHYNFLSGGQHDIIMFWWKYKMKYFWDSTNFFSILPNFLIKVTMKIFLLVDVSPILKARLSTTNVKSCQNNKNLYYLQMHRIEIKIAHTFPRKKCKDSCHFHHFIEKIGFEYTNFVIEWRSHQIVLKIAISFIVNLPASHSVAFLLLAWLEIFLVLT
jgi:hypothetical protein